MEVEVRVVSLLRYNARGGPKEVPLCSMLTVFINLNQQLSSNSFLNFYAVEVTIEFGNSLFPKFRYITPSKSIFLAPRTKRHQTQTIMYGKCGSVIKNEIMK